MRKEGLARWKKISGYHRRALAETAMSRFKQLMAGKITLRKYNGQVGEVMAYVGAINKLNIRGLPVRKPRELRSLGLRARVRSRTFFDQMKQV
jgi:hypothetical protein